MDWSVLRGSDVLKVYLCDLARNCALLNLIDSWVIFDHFDLSFFTPHGILDFRRTFCVFEELTWFHREIK